MSCGTQHIKCKGRWFTWRWRPPCILAGWSCVAWRIRLPSLSLLIPPLSLTGWSLCLALWLWWALCRLLHLEICHRSHDFLHILVQLCSHRAVFCNVSSLVACMAQWTIWVPSPTPTPSARASAPACPRWARRWSVSSWWVGYWWLGRNWGRNSISYWSNSAGNFVIKAHPLCLRLQHTKQSIQSHTGLYSASGFPRVLGLSLGDANDVRGKPRPFQGSGGNARGYHPERLESPFGATPRKFGARLTRLGVRGTC